MSSPMNQPPQLPEIADEAADTPSWVPRLGLAVFLVCALWFVWQHSHAGETVPQVEDATNGVGP